MGARRALPPVYVLVIDWSGDPRALIEFWRAFGCLGVGWGVADKPLDWRSYRDRVIVRDGRVHPAVLEIHDAPDGSLMWTRDPVDRCWYLGRVTGPWRYLDGPAAESVNAHNARPVQLFACAPASRVPRLVAERLKTATVIERVNDKPTARRSAALFAQLREAHRQPERTVEEILASGLSDEQVRSLVCRYLHRHRGYLSEPPTLRHVYGSWEYIVRDARGREAIVRASRGSSPVSRDAGFIPSHAVKHVFVFSPTGTYSAKRSSNVTELGYSDIVEFAQGEPRADRLSHNSDLAPFA